MKKLIAIALLVGLLVVPASAGADYWRQIGSLVPGTYMFIELDEAKTASLEYTKAIKGDELRNETLMDIESMWWGVTLNVTAEWNMNGIIQYLNRDPITPPEKAPIVFKKQGNHWEHIELPCKYHKGDPA